MARVVIMVELMMLIIEREADAPARQVQQIGVLAEGLHRIALPMSTLAQADLF